MCFGCSSKMTRVAQQLSPNPAYEPGMPEFQSQIPLYTSDRPEVQGVVAGLRDVANQFDDRVLIGEIYLPLERLMGYYGADLDRGVQLPFNFQLLAIQLECASVRSPGEIITSAYEGGTAARRVAQLGAGKS